MSRVSVLVRFYLAGLALTLALTSCGDEEILGDGDTALAGETTAATDDDTAFEDEGCTKDADCKGDRICINRLCVDPATTGNDDDASNDDDAASDDDDASNDDDASDDDDATTGDDDDSTGTSDDDDTGDDDDDETNDTFIDDASQCTDILEKGYACDNALPATCPDGICLLGTCIAPAPPADRWNTCDNGFCATCENDGQCPADCGPQPTFTGKKEYNNDTTISVWVHGFSNNSADELENTVFGADRGCSDVFRRVKQFGVDNPCWENGAQTTAANHLSAVEYYGAKPASWMSPADIAEIEQYPYSNGTTGLERYARIVAKFVKHKLAVTGATHAQIACHSMGCLITRHMIENDLEGLASGNKIVRWFTSTGVIAGARLARLYDNPTVRDIAELIGLELGDFIIMNPDPVQDFTARWDHKLQEGNNPLLRDMIIHHHAATDPRIAEALNIELLNLNNPDNEPNDGIMFTFDQFFHKQSEEASFHLPRNKGTLASTHSFAYYDHMTLPDTESTGVLATAGLFHRRKVRITLKQLDLYKSREKGSIIDFAEEGEGDSELAVESQVRYNPYLKDTFGRDVLVHETKIAHRSPDLFTMKAGEGKVVDYEVFAGPIFDDQTSLTLNASIQEVDRYARFGIQESLLDDGDEVCAFNGVVELKDGTFEGSSEFARCEFEVKIYELY